MQRVWLPGTETPPFRIARPGWVPAAFTCEPNSAALRCAPRIPGSSPLQQKTEQVRLRGCPPARASRDWSPAGAGTVASLLGTCGRSGGGLAPPGGQKTRVSADRPHRSGAMPSPRLVSGRPLPADPGAGRAGRSSRQQEQRVPCPEGEQRPFPFASESPLHTAILPAPWRAVAPHTWLGRGRCSPTSLPPKETGGRAPRGSLGPELGPCTPCSSDPRARAPSPRSPCP